MTLGRKRLVSKIEGIVYKHIYNNKRQIRYPVTLDLDDGVKGYIKKDFIMKVTPEHEECFYTGRYVFGANELYIYKAINEILEYLEQECGLDTIDSEELLEEEDD